MRLLLDTHSLFWWAARPRRLPQLARALISDPANEVLVSAVSAWEITAKHRAGKWPDVERFATGFAEMVRGYGFAELPITFAHAIRAGGLAGRNRDPFDRLLAGQALVEGLGFVTVDMAFLGFGVAVVWDAAAT